MTVVAFLTPSTGVKHVNPQVHGLFGNRVREGAGIFGSVRMVSDYSEHERKCKGHEANL